LRLRNHARKYADPDDLAIMRADGLAGSGKGAKQTHGNRRWIPPDVEVKSQH